MTDFFIQWTVVMPNILAGETAGLSLFTQYNPHGRIVALEAPGYLMVRTTFLFLAPLFTGGRLHRSLRWIFVASFVLAVGSFIGVTQAGYDIVLFEVIVITIDWAALIVAGILLGVLFGRSAERVPGQA